MTADPKRPKKKRRKRHSKSIIQAAGGRRCYLCEQSGDMTNKGYLEKHHVLFGMGRRDKSEADGLVVMLCMDHHREVHQDDGLRRRLCAVAQRAWEKEHRPDYGKAVRAKWIERYCRSYLDEEGGLYGTDSRINQSARSNDPYSDRGIYRPARDTDDDPRGRMDLDDMEGMA